MTRSIVGSFQYNSIFTWRTIVKVAIGYSVRFGLTGIKTVSITAMLHTCPVVTSFAGNWKMSFVIDPRCPVHFVISNHAWRNF